jgi:asparagine synthase (glutamine-hydrolysing)
MWVSGNGASPVTTYADVSAILRSSEGAISKPMKIGDARNELRLAVEDTVRRHLVADVDVGVFLSAGLDSATLASVASQLGGSLRTVTLGFDEFRGTPADETPLAEAVARAYRANHRTVWVRRDDFIDARDALLSRMDQPSIDGVNTYFVARAAASTGLKVALSGLGADELFGGYSSFREIPRLVRVVGRIPGVGAFGRAIRVISAPIVSRMTSPKYASVFEYGGDFASAYLLRRGLYMPWELKSVLDPDLVRTGLGDLGIGDRLAATVSGIADGRSKVSALESSWYMRNQLLRDADWASMSSSLEVRVPFVDWEFWKRVTPLIAATKGAIDKMTLASTPARPLPPAVLSRAKTGFSIPVRAWLLHEENGDYRGRGLRGWARFVYDRVAQVN